MYILKTAHMTAAGISIAGFILRGLWMLRASPRLEARWVRIVPHVVDTVLLATALAMLWRMRLNPFQLDWLTAKILALIVYIGLGMIALRFGRTRRQRFFAWAAAILVFTYIVAVAITRSPVLSSFG